MQDITPRKTHTKGRSTRRRSAAQPVSGRRVLFFLIASIIFFVLLSSVINLGHKYFAIREKLGELKTQEADVAQKKAALDEQNDFLNTQEGQEWILREKYNLVKPGEGVIVVTEPDTSVDQNAQHHTLIGNIWRSILRAIGFGSDKK